MNNDEESKFDSKDTDYSEGLYSPGDIADKENAAVDNTDGGLSASENRENQAVQNIPDSSDSKYKPGSKKSKSGGASNRKKFSIGLAVVSLLGGLLFSVASLILVPILHLKNLFADAYGGTQDTTVKLRRGRLYNKAYFFRDDKFDGYKQKGMFGFIKNRSSQKLITDLESKGFKITAEYDVNNKWTGRFQRIEIDGEVITDSSSSIWERRSAVRTALADKYPNRGFMWRSNAARKIYTRYGLNRANWWSDNALSRKIDAAQASAVQKLRAKFRGAQNLGPPASIRTNAPEPTEEQKKNNPNIEQELKDIDSSLADEIDAARNADPFGGEVASIVEPEKLAANAAGDLTDAATAAITKAPSAIKNSAINAFKITGVVDYACMGAKTLNSIEAGSRTAKRLQLIKAFTLYMSLLDSVRTGKVDSKSIAAMMTIIASKDPKTGKNGYQSGALSWASKRKGKTPHYANTYNVGGGATGAIRSFQDVIYGIIGGPRSVESTCKNLSKWWVQGGSLVIGTLAGVFTLGSFTTANFWANAALGIGLQLAVSFATPMLVNLAAGTMVNGWETGEKFMDMLGAASGAAYYMQGFGLGMRPLTKTEETALLEEHNRMEKEEFMQKPLYARIFDLSDTRSIISKAMINAPKSPSEFASALMSPLKIFQGKASASEEEILCNEVNIVENNIATDSFCNPIMGEAQIDNIDPMENFVWMNENGYVDDNGNPLGEYADYVKRCFEPDSSEVLITPGEYASTYSDTCIARGDSDKYLKFRAFRIDFALVNCIDKELDQDNCDDAVAADDTSSGTPGSFAGIDKLNCDGYQVLSSQPAVIVDGLPTNAPVLGYAQYVKDVCNTVKTQCLGSVAGTTKALCASLEFNDSWYGNGYSKVEGQGVLLNEAYYGLNQVTNALYNPAKWYEERKPGLNGYNLLECSALTSVSVYKAFGYDKAIGCSGRWGQRSNPALFKQINWNEVLPGDFITYSQDCNSGSGYGHIAIVASSPDSNGDFVVFHQASFGTTAHFKKFNTSTWGVREGQPFAGNISRWIGPGI